MSRLTRLLMKSFDRPSAVAAVPSASGWKSFRKMQESALMAYQADEHLIASARRLRNTLAAGALGVTIAMAGAGTVLSLHAGMVAASASPDQRMIAERFDALEHYATELYLLRGRGLPPDSLEIGETGRLLQESAQALGESLRSPTLDPAIKEAAMARLSRTIDSDLGDVAKRSGVDLASLVGDEAPAAPSGKQRKPASDLSL